MVFAMIFLLVFTYMSLGGITEAHNTLTDMADLVPAPLAQMGHQAGPRCPPSAGARPATICGGP